MTLTEATLLRGRLTAALQIVARAHTDAVGHNDLPHSVILELDKIGTAIRKAMEGLRTFQGSVIRANKKGTKNV